MFWLIIFLYLYDSRDNLLFDLIVLLLILHTWFTIKGLLLWGIITLVWKGIKFTVEFLNSLANIPMKDIKTYLVTNINMKDIKTYLVTTKPSQPSSYDLEVKAFLDELEKEKWI